MPRKDNISLILKRVIDHLSAHHGEPFTITQLSTVAGCDVTPHMAELANNPKISFHDNIYEYKPPHPINNKEEMLLLLQHSDHGILVNELKDCYPAAEADIKELSSRESIPQIYIVKTEKGASDIAFYSDPDPDYFPYVGKDIIDLWLHVDTPRFSELQDRLAGAGLPCLSTGIVAARKKAPKTQKKATRRRPTKVTNVHMPSLLDD
ncbi:putative transcription initiation factor TFIIE subunit beta [Paratrimastix pyriformis]|uniref:Transcription initiation factor TFIIE subunit beta n=1 Tax=Paratrimastix pyriformis TaxID=342808 RepID=A0ABQ8UD77_9EUKA|nr:putative transcription initiation factor TFIIE subunit beta [Paratrimastix pyriformis]